MRPPKKSLFIWQQRADRVHQKKRREEQDLLTLVLRLRNNSAHRKKYEKENERKKKPNRSFRFPSALSLEGEKILKREKKPPILFVLCFIVENFG
jgi:hypothetical protein